MSNDGAQRGGHGERSEGASAGRCSWPARGGAPARAASPLLVAALCLIAAASSACGGSQVRLVSPDTTAGSRYSCQPGEGQVCQPATTDVPEDLNHSGTVFVILPRECKGRVHQIVVLDAGSSHPKVDATCAPPEEPVEEMSSEPSAAPADPAPTARGSE
jgi:hypothetical protein